MNLHLSINLAMFDHLWSNLKEDCLFFLECIEEHLTQKEFITIQAFLNQVQLKEWEPVRIKSMTDLNGNKKNQKYKNISNQPWFLSPIRRKAGGSGLVY